MRFKLIIPEQRPHTLKGKVKRLWRKLFGKKRQGIVRVVKKVMGKNGHN